MSSSAFGAMNMYEQSYGDMGPAAYGPGLGMGYMPMQQPQLEPHRMAHAPQMAFDAEAFERAFDAASAEMQTREEEVQGLTRQAEVVDFAMKDSHVATFEINKARLDQTIISPESAVNQDQEQRKDQQNPGQQNPDSLAQTAGQLLDSVSHDTSEKFAQSSFLALMRRLRDREVVVEGENFIEVGGISTKCKRLELTCQSSTNAIANTTGMATEAVEEPESLFNNQGPPVEPDGSGDNVGEF
jgi:hypothetical protein